MLQVFGQFTPTPQVWQESLRLGFSFSPLPLPQRWRNNSLSANFIANYCLTLFMAQHEAVDTSNTFYKHLKGKFNYITNELLENAVKFHDHTTDQQVSIEMHFSKQAIAIYVTNSVSLQAAHAFQEYLQQINENDPNDLYVRQLERNAAEEDGTESRIGLLTVINNYNDVCIGWKLETIKHNPEIVAVTTMVQFFIS